jgi:hypothetical protein
MNENPTPDPLLDLGQLVALRGLNKSLWRRAIYRGELRCHKFGARGAKVWVRLSDVDSFLAAKQRTG